jgi:nitrogen fixation protein FixH
MVKKLLLLFIGAIVINLIMTTVALAGWTPQDIYDDFVANGKLTRDYTEAELKAYLNDASLAQYSDDDLKKRLDDVVKDRLTRDEFPFTGFQIGILAVGVVALIGGGVALRRLSRPHRMPPADKN